MRSNERSNEPEYKTKKASNKSNPRELRDKRLRIRQAFMLVMFIFTFLGVTARMVYIKVVKGEAYEAKAVAQQINKYDQIIEPLRGSIVDRNKQSLAISIGVYDVILDPRVLIKHSPSEQERTITTLNSELSIPIAELRSYIQLENGELTDKYDTNYLPIAKKISRDAADRIKNESLKGVWLLESSQRHYVHNSLGSYIVGFIRGDAAWGLEGKYYDELSGTPGRKFLTFENSGKTATHQQIDPVQGNTLVTTIDQALQQYAENTVSAAMSEYEPLNASVIMMDPKTGELLAMASHPGYDLNNPSIPAGMTAEEYEQLAQAMTDAEQSDYLNKMWRNYNISDTFEPGSIFKPFTVAMALEESLITPNSTYVCTGSKIVFGDESLPCHLLTGHGTVNVETAIAQSCNVAMMDIAAVMGRDVFFKYQHDFGFGEKTGIDLPGEADAAPNVYTLNMLNPVQLATSSFGQGFNCTPLQAITAFCSLINGGNLMKPHFVSHVVDSKGVLVKEFEPTIQRKVISQDTSNVLRYMMRDVLETGTGKKAKIPGYAIGGKTGTAQQGIRDNKEYVLSYVTYLPVDDPSIAIITSVDRPKYYVDNVTTIAPLVRDLLQRVIDYLAIPPSDESEEKAAQENTVLIEDYTGQDVTAVTPRLGANDITFELAGNGSIITGQTIRAGEMVSAGAHMIFYVQPDEVGSRVVLVPDLTGLDYSTALTVLTDCEIVPTIANEVKNITDDMVVINQGIQPYIYVYENEQMSIEFGTLSVDTDVGQ